MGASKDLKGRELPEGKSGTVLMEALKTLAWPKAIDPYMVQLGIQLTRGDVLIN